MTTSDDARRSLGDRTLSNAKEIIYDIHTGRDIGPGWQGIARCLSDLVDQHYADLDTIEEVERFQAESEQWFQTSGEYVKVAETVRAKLTALLATMAEDANDDALDWDEMVKGIAESIVDAVDDLRDIG